MTAPPLRLLMTADAVGGVWQYATELAAALRPSGVETTLALLGPAPSEEQCQALAAAGLVSIETELPLDWLCDSRGPVEAAGRRLAALAGEGGFDLVQVNAPALAAAAFPVPVVAAEHGSMASWWLGTHAAPLPPDLAWHRELGAAGLRAAALVVAPTVAHAELVRRAYGLATAPLAVHNGRRPLGPPPRAAMHDFAFTAGRLWDEAKETALLDRVAARLSIPFYAAGPTAGPHGQRAATEHLVLTGTIPQADLAERLSRRPVFVSAARFEPFGLAVLEAAAAGCPLVLSDLPGFHELWDGAALFVGVGDEAGFARAIDEVVGDEGARVVLGRAAEERAARYTPAATAAAMARLYRGLRPARAAA